MNQQAQQKAQEQVEYPPIAQIKNYQFNKFLPQEPTATLNPFVYYSPKIFHEKKKIKIAFIGQSYTGKTSIINCYLQSEMPSYHLTHQYYWRFKQIEVEDILHSNKNGQICNKINLELECVDFGDRYQYKLPDWAKAKIRDVDGIVFVYDLSLQSILVERWIPYCLKCMKKGTNVIVVGNKSDKKKQDCLEKVQEKADYYGIQFAEVSAATGENIKKVINEFIYKITLRKVVDLPLKQIYMLMLLWLNEDFDDDLLMDAMMLLVDC